MPFDLSKPRLTDGEQAALLVGVITLVGFALRLSSFGDALFGDELSTYVVVEGRNLSGVIDLVDHRDQEISPPLYFIFAWLSQKIGASADWLRLPSLIAGTATIPLTYLLGAWTVGRRAALVGAALIALSPFLIFYSDEARAYALLPMLLVGSTLLLLRAVDRGGPGWWAGYAICVTAALYTHYTAVFVLGAQFLWAFFVHPEARKWLLGATALAAVAFLPWVPAMLEDRDSPGTALIGAVVPFVADNVRHDLGVWALGGPYIPIQSLPGGPALAMIAAGLIVGAVGLVLRARSEPGGWRPSSLTVLVLALALATPVGAALYSLVGESLFTARNLIASSPGLALAAGALLTGATAAILRLAAIVLVVGGMGIGAIKMLDPDNQRPDYEAAARLINKIGAPGDPVVDVPVLNAPGAQQALEVALAPDPGSPTEDHPVFRLGIPTLEDELRIREPGGPGQFARPPVPPPAEIGRTAGVAAGRSGRLFLVTPAEPGAREDLIERFIAALPPGFEITGEATFPGFAEFGLTLSVFERTAAAG